MLQHFIIEYKVVFIVSSLYNDIGFSVIAIILDIVLLLLLFLFVFTETRSSFLSFCLALFSLSTCHCYTSDFTTSLKCL